LSKGCERYKKFKDEHLLIFMRVIKNNKGLTIVLSGGGDSTNCPTLNLRGKRVVLRDDYHGRVRFRSNVLDAISKL